MPQVLPETTPDLVLMDYSFLEIRYAVGDGTYVSVRVAPPDTANDNYGAFGFADLNGDGVQDLYMQSAAPQNLYVGAGNGAGGFTFGSQIASPLDHIAGVSVSRDFDGDGDVDILFGHSSIDYTGLTLATNNGSGIFTETVKQTSGGGVYGLAAGDVDGDGDDDVVAIFEESIGLFVNNHGAFQLSTGVQDTVAIPGSVKLIDVDGDHDLDIVVADVGRIVVETNDGTGKFTDTHNVTLQSDGYFNDVGAADFDRDGDIDFIGLNGYTNEVALWRNGGAGVYTKSAINVGGAIGPKTISIADLDGDGDLDAFVYTSGRSATGSVPNQAPRAIRLINDGAGHFTGTAVTIPSDLTLIGAMTAFVNVAIQGGAGADALVGNAWADQMLGGDGNDTLSGMNGYDTLSGGLGADVLYGNLGNDILYGNQDNDILYGGQGNDAGYGGQGDDLLFGNIGDDQLFGNLGADTLNGGTGANTLDGADGIDTASYADAASAVNVSLLLAGSAQATGISSDTLIAIENLTGSAFNDVLTGDAAVNVLSGGFGADTLNGGVGADVLYGNQDNDRLYGNQDNDVLYGGAGDDVLVGGIGADRMQGNLGADRFLYLTAADSPTTGFDQITEFTTGQDKIDLRTIHAADQCAAFTVTSGAGVTTLEVDLGHNGSIDMKIVISGVAVAGDVLWT